MKQTALLEQKTRWASKADEHKASLQYLVGLLTEEDVCLLLEVSEHTLQAWRQRGRGPNYVKLEKGIYYRIDDLVEYLQRNVVVPEPTNAEYAA